MEQVARAVAEESMNVIKTIPYKDWVSLDMWEEELELGVRKPSHEDVDEAVSILKQTENELKTLREIYARETVLLEDWPETVKTVVQAIRIGDLGIATFPGEAFVELGLEVKRKSPFPSTFCIELANDYRGYIPTEAGASAGGVRNLARSLQFFSDRRGSEDGFLGFGHAEKNESPLINLRDSIQYIRLCNQPLQMNFIDSTSQKRKKPLCFLYRIHERGPVAL